jgi:integrase
MAVHLTDSAITKALRVAAETKRRRNISDAKHEGLRIRITPAGTATWSLQVRDKTGRLRDFRLGSYPKTGVGAAREAAKAMWHRVRHDGADPIAERRQERERAEAERQSDRGLEGLLASYEERVLPKKKNGAGLRSWPEYKASINRVFTKHLTKPLGALTLGDLQLAADDYPAPHQASLAVRCLRPILKWASGPGRSYVTKELADIAMPTPTARRERHLDRNELAKVLPVLKASARPHAALMRFILLTLARLEEAAGATWGEIDLGAKTWTIPASRVKNRREHVVPLSAQAIALLCDRQPKDEEGNTTNPEPDDFVFMSGAGTALQHWDRETKAVSRASGVADWHRHDLRRTSATALGMLGTPPHVIEAALNHAAIHSSLAATYNLGRYQREVADALQRLADWLDAVEAGQDNVRPLRAAS